MERRTHPMVSQPVPPARPGVHTSGPGPGAAPRLTVLLAVSLLAGVASGCVVDTARYPALDEYTPAVGTNARTQQVDALGFAVVIDGDGNGRVVGTLKNTENQPHALTGAAIKTEGIPVQAAVLTDVVPLPPHEPVDLAEAPAVSVTTDVAVGDFIELSLDVTDGELVHMLVPVEAPKGPYADVDVLPVPDGTLSLR